MFCPVAQNRWFIWTIVLSIIVALLVWWQVMEYSIEQDISTETDQIIITNKKSPEQNGSAISQTEIKIIKIGNPPITFNIVSSAKDLFISDVGKNRFTVSDNILYQAMISVEDNARGLSVKEWILTSDNWYWCDSKPHKENYCYEEEFILLGDLRGVQYRTIESGEGELLFFNDSEHKRIIIAEVYLFNQGSLTYATDIKVALTKVKSFLKTLQL
jgi:hypothetical protein